MNRLSPYRSTAMATAKPSGRTSRSFPLPASCQTQFAGFALTQEFQMRLDGNFPPAPKNTPASAAAFNAVDGTDLKNANAILTSLTPPMQLGCGLGSFQATFHIVPASWNDFQTGAVTFPGWINGPAALDSRPALTRTVAIRTRHDYFVLDPAAVLTGAGVVDSAGNAITIVASKGAIPIIERAQWLNTRLDGGNRVPIENSEVPDLVPAGGAAVGTGVYNETAPTLGHYQSWCEVATAFRASLLAGTAEWTDTAPPLWDGSGTATTYGQYCIADSILADYAGNIVDRITSYALFQ